jgi:LmbE family N-acetylglucosaminyl deacetylase
MERRDFLKGTLAGGAVAGGMLGMTGAPPAYASQSNYMMYTDDLVIDRDRTGRPYEGRVLAAIQPHADDIPIYAGGTVAKLISEGYTGYLINTTNDDHAGPGTVGDTVVANESDILNVAKILGLKKVYWLGYRNHRMEDIEFIEMKARLICLIRALKIDTIITYDPYGLYEENPDHWVTARVVEAACWMAAGAKDYPEHAKAGLAPRGISVKYYHARGPQFINRVVDISSYIDKKAEANAANTAQGSTGNRGATLRASLAKQGQRLPILGDDDRTSNMAYYKQFQLGEEKTLGQKYGLGYAEAFHYIGPAVSTGTPTMQDYIKQNQVPLK